MLLSAFGLAPGHGVWAPPTRDVAMLSASTGVPPHPVEPQRSFSVQASPSSHATVVSTDWAHVPVAGLHESVVQGLPSSHEMGHPVHLPPLHVSPVVHGSPSSHATAGPTEWTHVPVASHESAV